MCYLLVRQPLCLCHSQPLHWLFSQVSDGRSAEHETDPLPSAQGLNGTHAQTHTNMCALTDLSSVTERHGGDHSSSGSILTDRWVFYTKYYQAQTNSFVIQSNNGKENLCNSSANTPDMNMFLSPPQQSSDLQVKKDTDTHHLALSKWLFRVGEKDDKAVTIQVSLELNINISYWFPFCPDTEKRTISQQKTVLFNLLFTPRLLSLFILLYRLLLPRLEIMT